MGKIYYGKRGSGKTTRLLKQAAALTEDDPYTYIEVNDPHYQKNKDE